MVGVVLAACRLMDRNRPILLSEQRTFVGQLLRAYHSRATVSLVPAAILGVIAMATATGSELLLADAPRLSLMVVSYVAYFAIFAALALAVSAKAPSSNPL